mmetsp:Transcript_12254/g.36435  ORF Transcript_12254/g.36435 Transcript_12254/m.36435 type:complete len:164 (-) Transcript_12254:21-512(-)
MLACRALRAVAARRTHAAAPRRAFSAGGNKPAPQKPSTPGAPKTKMTREEVEALAEAAKAQQRLVKAESRLFGGDMSPTHPFVLALLAACIGLHYYNAGERTKREEEEALLERLRTQRRTAPLTERQRAEVLAHKRRQLAACAPGDAYADRLRAEIDRMESDG